MATLIDISKKTGLAVSTVSKYFNGGSVRKYNREKIELALQEMDYQPNLIARSLKTRKTNVYGILIPNLQSSFDINIVSLIIKELSKRGYGTIVSLYESKKNEAKGFASLRDEQVDGIIILPSGKYDPVFQNFINSGKKLVAIDRPIENLPISTVITNNYEISCKALQKLVDAGHRSIAIITDSSVYTGSERLRAYKDVMEKNKIELNEAYIKDTAWSINYGRRFMTEILEKQPEITALFICSEEFTIGCYQVINEKGLSVPHDISVISFDLYGFSSMLTPTISAIYQPLSKMSKCAVDILLSDENEAKSHVFPASLISENTIRKL